MSREARESELRLSVKNARVLAYIEQQLRDGFTGELRLECFGGGVRELQVTQRYSGKELGTEG